MPPGSAADRFAPEEHLAKWIALGASRVEPIGPVLDERPKVEVRGPVGIALRAVGSQLIEPGGQFGAVALGKDPAGKDVLIKYGAFIQTIFDFVIIALVLFIAIKGINKLKKPAPAAPAPPARSEVLLEEIRDLLAKRA